MIQATFFKSKDTINGFSIKGHAGFDDIGYDIVCASVSSAVQLTANTLTEIYGVNANIKILENLISLKCNQDNSEIDNVDKLLKGLKLHIECLSEDFPNTIKINTSEV